MGRPTDYNIRFCDELVTHMEQGLSYESFAGSIGTCKQTLYNWEKAHKEFLDSKEIGFEKSRLFWERAGIKLATEGIGNATAFVFNMKNKFRADWNDKTEIDNNHTIIPDAKGFIDELLK